MMKPPNYDKVMKICRDRYVLVPLEIFTEPYQALVVTMMSSRTNDDTTLLAGQRLFKEAPDWKSLRDMPEEKIAKLIYPVGFYKTKANNLKKLAEMIISEYNGKVPDTREELIKLPGVGIKTANVVLGRAFDKQAIAVDTHVFRISHLLGWADAKTPEETQRQLEKIVPEQDWREMCNLFVSLGRQFKSKRKLEEFLKENALI